MVNFFFAIILLIIGQVLTFYQIQGPIKYEFIKNNIWIPVLMGIPISMLFMGGMTMLIKYYEGALWPSRIIGFSIGTIVYGMMANLVFNESVNLKTTICLILSLIIILVQVFWKE